MGEGSFSRVYRLLVIMEELVRCSDNSVNREFTQTLFNHLECVFEILKRSLYSELDDAIYLELECFVLDSMVAQIEKGVEFSMDEVENLKEKIHSFSHRLKLLEEQFIAGLYNSFPDDDDYKDEPDVDVNVVGLADVYHKLKLNLMSSRVVVTSLVGMPGIGKTTLANKAFHNPRIVESFGSRVWVRLGRGCSFKDVPWRILAEMGDDIAGDENENKLKERLESERCLVVLDDVWDAYMTYLLDPSYRWNKHHRNHPFLGCNSGSRFLVISRLRQFGEDGSQLNPRVVITMRLMDKDESWTLLRDKVFSQGMTCPPQLEKAGKKIAENCEGLPLTIVTLAGLLSNEEKTPEYWNEFAAKRNHQIFLDAYHEMLEVLLPSYTYLPRILQICFLFMGLFRQNYEIPRMKLINLWHVDGFEEINFDLRLESNAIKYLEGLVCNSLVIVYKESILNPDHTVKTCGLHSSLWHLSNKKAKESNFSIILDSINDVLDDAMKDHLRLSFHNNVLFGIKDVREIVEDECASTARSLLCFGPYHQYEVPLCYRLKLLRELDAVSIRFYEFPMEVLQLALLKYLTLTLNGMIPPSISQLTKLQFLIVDRHTNIKSASNGPSYLPVEIWELEELKHLQVTGSDLPDPRGASLENLSTLVDVSACSCTEAVVKAIPNLKELRIRIEMAFDDDGKTLNCFTHISHHLRLRHLKCVVVNPGVARPNMPFSSFQSLQSLSLSGLGYPWKEMSKIASLTSLYVLKLKNYAFRGPEWEVEGRRFMKLGSLVIQDTDLNDWKVGSGGFTFLKHLRMKDCYKLEKIDGDFGWFLEKVELVDCNPLCVHEMKKAIPNHCVLDVKFSWDDTKRKSLHSV